MKNRVRPWVRMFAAEADAAEAASAGQGTDPGSMLHKSLPMPKAGKAASIGLRSPRRVQGSRIKARQASGRESHSRRSSGTV